MGQRRRRAAGGRRCRPTHPAAARVTVHVHSGATSSAVDLADGCFGTTTVMRIASMFVPTNIFEVRPSPASIPAEACRSQQSFSAWRLDHGDVPVPLHIDLRLRRLLHARWNGVPALPPCEAHPARHIFTARNDVMRQRSLHRITAQTAAGSARITRSRRRWRRLPGSPEGRAPPPRDATACRAP